MIMKMEGVFREYSKEETYIQICSLMIGKE